MKGFKIFLKEGGGEAAGKMELVKITEKQARAFIKKVDPKFDIEKEFKDFSKSFGIAQRAAGLGQTKRKDMPVLNGDVDPKTKKPTEDVEKLQRALEDGRIDHKPPFKDDESAKRPFPEGLSGSKAKEWMEKGLKDGSKDDDPVDVTIERIKAKDLKPIQQQIYYDKSMKNTVENGVDKSIKFLAKKSFFVKSKDNYIIDGHHRWLSTMLIDPETTVNALSIDMPISELLDLTRAFGDALGNRRNA